MRLLIVGTLNGQLSTATKMAMAKGAKVTHTETVDQAIETLRSGRGADLMMVDVAMDIENLIFRLQATPPLTISVMVTPSRSSTTTTSPRATSLSLT